MELGEKLLHARQEAGLSQRQLCGDYMTRNMLSQIEHGTARPSMDTLRYLAGRLGKPVSFFLEEDAVLSPNQTMMASARQKWEAGEVQEAWLLLKSFRQPDPVLEWEWKYLSALTAMEAAELAKKAGKNLYARQILEETVFDIPELERQRLLRLGTVSGSDLPEIVRQLPSLDDELLLRAEAALLENRFDRASALLEAAEDSDKPRWLLLRGTCLFGQKRYRLAAEVLQQAEAEYPEDCQAMLEICFRELGDFKRAYEYACKRR